MRHGIDGDAAAPVAPHEVHTFGVGARLPGLADDAVHASEVVLLQPVDALCHDGQLFVRGSCFPPLAFLCVLCRQRWFLCSRFLNGARGE